MSDTYDYIIVGSGAAGSVLAYRLSEGGRHSVLVIENGPGFGNPLHTVPKGFFFTLDGDRYAYNYATEPIAGTETSEVWTRGKVAGGSTTVNGMIYNRGAEPEFEELAKHSGASRWGWDSFLTAYRAMEDHDLGWSPTRGVGGRLGISAAGPRDEISDRVFAAGAAMGWQQVADINEHDTERIGFTPSFVQHGRRTSAGFAYLKPAVRRKNVTLLTRTRAMQILIRDGRAVGVRASRRDSTLDYSARKEVIVAAGTIETPILLERSGIGRGDVLRELGVTPVRESPNVGERVIEQHFPATIQARFNRDLGATKELNSLLKQGLEGVKYLLTRKGPIARAGYDFTFHCKSQPELDRPDLMGTITPFAIDPTASSMKLADHSGMLVGLYQIRPETTSSIHSSSADPMVPKISPRYFETDTDVQASSQVLRICREILAQDSLSEIIEGEDFPTSAVLDDPESAMAHAKDYGTPLSHAVGSCAMGQHDDDVVDNDLRVRGIDGLRVVDASVFPFHVSSSTAGPVSALGWIASEMILEN